MMFGSASVPIVFWFAPPEKPSLSVMPYVFGMAPVPSALVPILLPTTRMLAVVFSSWIPAEKVALVALPEMTLPRMVFAPAPLNEMPTTFASAAVPAAFVPM